MVEEVRGFLRARSAVALECHGQLSFWDDTSYARCPCSYRFGGHERSAPLQGCVGEAGIPEMVHSLSRVLLICRELQRGGAYAQGVHSRS